MLTKGAAKIKVIIVGGGQAGFYTADSLKKSGHDVCVIDSNRKTCQSLADRLDIIVVCDDGTTVEALVAAGIEHADALVALTNRDEDNIVACQIAKNHFNVKRVIARANNPKNLDTMRMLGADNAVSSTSIITNLIEMEVDHEVKLLATLNKGEAGIMEIAVPDGYNAEKIPLKSIILPKGCIIVSVVRGTKMEIPRGDFIITGGDHITAVVSRKEQSSFKKAFRVKE